MVDRKDDIDLLCLCCGKEVLCGVKEIILYKGLSDRVTLDLEEGISHSATDDDCAAGLYKGLQDGDL